MKRLLKKAELTKVALGWVSIENKGPMARAGYGVGDPEVETYYETGILSLDTLDYAEGFNGENHQWHEEAGYKYFGKYPEDKWNEFLEDIKANGIRERIIVQVEPQLGLRYIWEGNHRVEAARQLGLTEIPAKVIYMGGAEQNFKIWD